MFTMIKLMREANKAIQEGLIGNPQNRIYTGIVFFKFWYRTRTVRYCTNQDGGSKWNSIRVIL